MTTAKTPLLNATLRWFLNAIVLANIDGAPVLGIWMATTMRFAASHPSEQPTLASFRSNLGRIVVLLVGGGIMTWIFIKDGIADTASLLPGDLQPLYVSKIVGLSVTQIGWLSSILAIVMTLVPFLLAGCRIATASVPPLQWAFCSNSSDRVRLSCSPQPQPCAWHSWPG